MKEQASKYRKEMRSEKSLKMGFNQKNSGTLKEKTEDQEPDIDATESAESDEGEFAGGQNDNE